MTNVANITCQMPFVAYLLTEFRSPYSVVRLCYLAPLRAIHVIASVKSQLSGVLRAGSPNFSRKKVFHTPVLLLIQVYDNTSSFFVRMSALQV